ncbi:MAG: outer membrane lipoprotein-sorting protein [Deferribacterales bacterium]
MKKILIIIVLSLSAVSALAKEPSEILRIIDRNLSPVSYESYRKLINIEPDGDSKEFVLYTVKKGNDKISSLFLSPASENGRSTLRLGDNMWLYIPNVGRPVRITSLQSVIGGVFNNADIMSLDYTQEYDVELMEESSDRYVLYLKAKTKTVAYAKVTITADKKTMLPISIDCLTDEKMLIKTLHFSDVKDFGDGIKRPAVIETDSPLYKGYKSVMIFAKVKSREFPDEIFTMDFMSRMQEIR